VVETDGPPDEGASERLDLGDRTAFQGAIEVLIMNE